MPISLYQSDGTVKSGKVSIRSKFSKISGISKRSFGSKFYDRSDCSIKRLNDGIIDMGDAVSTLSCVSLPESVRQIKVYRMKSSLLRNLSSRSGSGTSSLSKTVEGNTSSKSNEHSRKGSLLNNDLEGANNSHNLILQELRKLNLPLE